MFSRIQRIWELTRVESTLQEPLDLAGVLGLDLTGLLLEDIDELATNELALLLGVVDALETSQELLRSINNSKVDAELLLENVLNESALVQAHAAVVDQDSVETVTNGLSHELGSNGRVDTTADGTQDLASRANQVADTGDLLANELRHGPGLLGTTNANSKVLKELTALRSV
jgi:hypothetical protein